MDIHEFVAQTPAFASLSHTEKIKLLGWYLLTHESKDHFRIEDLRRCYDALSYEAPNFSRDLARLVDRTPPELLRSGTTFRIEARVRASFDRQYGQSQSTLAVSKLLTDLPAHIPGIDERAFLHEVLACYKAGAFRATVVMAWNLAFDHVLRWILRDPARLSNFNARIPLAYPKKAKVVIKAFEDFEDLKESEIVALARSANLITGGIVKVLQKELARRNSAAHPSAVIIIQSQADDCITDLVNNVVHPLR